jgi:hypothetical protein
VSRLLETGELSSTEPTLGAPATAVATAGDCLALGVPAEDNLSLLAIYAALCYWRPQSVSVLLLILLCSHSVSKTYTGAFDRTQNLRP